MTKVTYISNAGYARLVDERVAAHLVKKGRGSYETRDLRANAPAPAVAPAPVVVTPVVVTEPVLTPGSDPLLPSNPEVVVPTPADAVPAAVTFPEAEKPAPVTGNSGKPLSAKERRELARSNGSK